MVETTLLIDVEARTFLFVKWTEANQVSSASLKLHTLPDDIGQVRLIPNAVDGLGGNHVHSNSGIPKRAKPSPTELAFMLSVKLAQLLLSLLRACQGLSDVLGYESR